MTMNASPVPLDSVRFVKELYPRVREDDAAVERYRAAIDLLPPIVLARDGILVDGYHRLKAHRMEQRPTIQAVHLGELSDVEIVKESIRRNAAHGRQLDTSDKKRMADRLYRQGTRDYDEIAALLSITLATAKEYARDARRDEVAEQKADLWDRWLNCEWLSYREASGALGIDDKTVAKWLAEFPNSLDVSAPESRQDFDVWQFATVGTDTGHFGKIAPQVIENLLWLFTDQGQTVVDPFAGSGTVIDVAKAMGRRIWASDLHPTTETLPIHGHDIAAGWPDDAPRKADLIFLDPPYWMQAAGRYSSDSADLANMNLDDFMQAWSAVVKNCAAHLHKHGRLAFIVSPAQDGSMADGRVVDLAYLMYRAADDAGLSCERRIIATYNAHDVGTGQAVDAARAVMTLPITPDAFKPTEDRIAALITSWGWHVQKWGQETIDPQIRRILSCTENGLRHIADLLVARPATQRCPACALPHDGIVVHVDAKSSTRSEATQTGKQTLEVKAWATLRAESRSFVPAVFIFEPFQGCPDRHLKWSPALHLESDDLYLGPFTGNGSGDPWWFVKDALLRPIQQLRCWGGWA